MRLYSIDLYRSWLRGKLFLRRDFTAGIDVETEVKLEEVGEVEHQFLQQKIKQKFYKSTNSGIYSLNFRFSRGLYLVLFVLCSMTTLQAKPLSVQVKAPSAILINLDTGAILYAKEAHQRNFPASITKIATALYVLERKGHVLSDSVQASREALMIVPSHVRLAAESKHPPYRLEIGGTQMGICPEEKLSLSALLYGLLLPSGNDAGNVLAEAVSGTVDRFMTELNLFFKQHGITETHFVNPHGLHHPDHWTTAYDMAQITSLALKHSAFREVVKATQYLKPQSNKQPPRLLAQHNRLLRAGPYFYSKAIGVKTGYHSQSRYTFVGAATYEGRTLIAVLLNCAESHDRFRDAIKLFEVAFAEKKISRTLFAREGDQFKHVIQGGAHELQAILKDDVILEYYPAEEPQFHAEIRWATLKLPLAVGDTVGHLRCLDHNGNVLLEKPLFASHAVSKQLWIAMVDFCTEHKALFLALFLGGQVVLLLLYFFKKHQKIG